MQDLISEGIARLAGVRLKRSFTSSRQWAAAKPTYLSVSAYSPSTQSSARRTALEWPPPRRSQRANIAAFNGRNNPDHFFWGEIASQLGKGDQFKTFWTSGPKAPDERDWSKLFEGDQPVLILLDEMPPYFHYLDTQKVGNGTVADIATRAFANLLTAAGKKKNVCVVVSDLAAAYEPAAGSSIAHSKTPAQKWVAKSVASRRSTSPPTRSTTSCASDSSNCFPTRPRSAISLNFRPQAGRGRQIQDRQPRR